MIGVNLDLFLFSDHWPVLVEFLNASFARYSPFSLPFTFCILLKRVILSSAQDYRRFQCAGVPNPLLSHYVLLPCVPAITIVTSGRDLVIIVPDVCQCPGDWSTALHWPGGRTVAPPKDRPLGDCSGQTRVDPTQWGSDGQTGGRNWPPAALGDRLPPGV